MTLMATPRRRPGRPALDADQLALEVALARIRGGLSRDEVAAAKGISRRTASRLFARALGWTNETGELLRDEAKRIGVRIPGGTEGD